MIIFLPYIRYVGRMRTVVINLVHRVFQKEINRENLYRNLGFFSYL